MRKGGNRKAYLKVIVLLLSIIPLLMASILKATMHAMLNLSLVGWFNRLASFLLPTLRLLVIVGGDHVEYG